MHYASSDGEPGFHLDAMPAVDSNSYAQRKWNFEINNDPRVFAVAITDNEDPSYERVGEGWLASNPLGYAKWFHFQQRDRRRLQRDLYASAAGMATEDVPEFKIKTPLQRAIQFLKRHRDKIFEGDNEVKPISIIITTLVAQCYSNEDSVEAVIASFIRDHEQYIEDKNDGKWISNPVNAEEENFADKWPDHPERQQAFYFWMEVLRNDFASLLAELKEIGASVRIRDFLQEAPSGSRQWTRPNISHGLPAPTFRVGHKQAPPWALKNKYKVRIRGAYMPKRGGFTKWLNVVVNQTIVPKGCDLRFTAIVEAPKRKRLKYKWQVVNTGSDAANARGLRGDFYAGLKKRGGRVRTEESSYEGFHWVQCFVLEGNECVGVSDEFIVNIK